MAESAIGIVMLLVGLAIPWYLYVLLAEEARSSSADRESAGAESREKPSGTATREGSRGSPATDAGFEYGSWADEDGLEYGSWSDGRE